MKQIGKHSSGKKYSRMDLSIQSKLPKKKFFERHGSESKHTNSMYAMEASDLGREFLNDGLKLSP